VARRDGLVTCTALPDPAPVNDSANPYFQRVLANHGFAIGDFRIGRLSGKPTLAFGYPLLDGKDQIKAVIFTAMDLASLNDLAAHALMPSGATLTAIDRKGIILARYPDPEKWVGHSSTETPIYRIVLRQNKEGTAEALGEDQVSRLYSFVPLSGVPDQDMFLIVGIPTAVAYAELNQTLTRDLVALGVVAALALAAAWVGGDVFLLRRIRNLLAVTQRIAHGDLKARTGINNPVGELDQLAFGFDQMGRALEKRECERNLAEQEMLRRAAQAEVLVQIATRLNAQLDLSSVLNALCTDTAAALNVCAASVYMCDEHSQTLTCAASLGLTSEDGASVYSLTRAELTEQIKAAHSILVYEDIQAQPGLPDSALDSCPILRTSASAAMLRDEQVIGVVCIFSVDEPRLFLDDELILLRELAAVGALAITNARLYAELQFEERARAKLLHQVITAQEDERMRIARELHDETSQSLTALMMGLDTARLVLYNNPKKVEEQLETSYAIAKGMLENIHRLISDLRPSLLDDLGLVPAIHWYGEQRLQPLGIRLCLDQVGLQGRLPATMETVLFRIVQEALTNVVRHSHASIVSIRLAWERDNLLLEIADDGEGFEPLTLSALPNGKGFGLRGMQERVKILKGEFQVLTGPGRGTLIRVRVPHRKVEAVHVQDSSIVG
jgi:signal transduction histidine kinase